jgi:hypothetical protein
MKGAGGHSESGSGGSSKYINIYIYIFINGVFTSCRESELEGWHNMPWRRPFG